MNDEQKQDLIEKAQKLIDASEEYWREYRKAGLKGAVIWLEASDGRLIIFTRGEYREDLKKSVNNLEHGLATQIPIDLSCK